MHVMMNRLVRAAVTVFGAVWLAVPVLAAEVVDVRIGTHSTFTRVVFELDGASGYQVERQLAEDGMAQLLVTMDAGSGPRSLDSSSLMVERVAVQDGVERSVAHIRLKRKPSQLKELILTNPPRLVFDFVYPEPVLAARKAAAEAVATTAPPKPEPQTKLAASPRERQPAAPVSPRPAMLAVAPKPQAEPAPQPKTQPMLPPKVQPAPLAEAREAPKRVALKPALKSTAMPAPDADAGPAVPEAAAPVANATESKVVEPPITEAQAEGAAAGEDVTNAIRTAAAGEPEAAKPAEPAPKRAARSALPAAPASPAKRPGADWKLVGGVAAGVAALFIMLFVWNRRRALPNDFDVAALAEAADGDDVAAPQKFAMGLDEEPESAESTLNAPEPAAAPQAEPEIASGPGLFDDDFDKESDAMDLENPDQPMERTASEMPTQMGVAVETASAGDGDVARMLREFESRLVKFETQLDEANDARERLERQVTAQAEELRVQRAAIARAQRALRGMNRGEAEQATEPALREPSS